MSSGGFNAGDFARITINDKPISVDSSIDHNNNRGLHIVVINPRTYEIE